MNESCPISNNKTGEKAGRINGFFVLMLLIGYGLTGYTALVLLLILDFCIKIFINPAKSPLSFISKKTVSLLKLKESKIDLAPKLFAAKIGLLFSITTALLAFAGFNQAALATASVFAICSALEAFVGFCLGCKMYTLINSVAAKYKLLVNKSTVQQKR